MTLDEVNGATSWISCFRASQSQSDLETSGDFPIFATRMEEVIIKKNSTFMATSFSGILNQFRI